MARITRTRSTVARMTLSRAVSRLFDHGSDGPAIHEATQTYRAAAREYLRTHPEVREVVVYMSERFGGSQTDIIEA